VRNNRANIAVVQEAQKLRRRPLLLLVLPKIPPIQVKGNGLMPLEDAIAKYLQKVLLRCQHKFAALEEVFACKLFRLKGATLDALCLHEAVDAWRFDYNIRLHPQFRNGLTFSEINVAGKQAEGSVLDFLRQGLNCFRSAYYRLQNGADKGSSREKIQRLKHLSGEDVFEAAPPSMIVPRVSFPRYLLKQPPNEAR
jgi:hypothetical protein